MHHIIELALEAKSKREQMKHENAKRQNQANSECASCNYQNNYYGDQICDRSE